MDERLRLIERTETKTIQYEGFTSEQKIWVDRLVRKTGLPLSVVDTVRYKPNDSGNEDILGTYHYADTSITLWKNLGKDYGVPREIVQLGVVAHENAHGFDPFVRSAGLSERIDKVYGSEEKRIETARHVLAVAEQSDKTQIFLNAYHKHNWELLEAARIAYEEDPTPENEALLAQNELSFYMETHAIMVELRFTNLEHLKQVEESQRRKWAKMGNNEEFVGIVEGVENTLVNVMPDISSRKQLDRHIRNVKAEARMTRTPLTTPRSARLAA